MVTQVVVVDEQKVAAAVPEERSDIHVLVLWIQKKLFVYVLGFKEFLSQWFVYILGFKEYLSQWPLDSLVTSPHHQVRAMK